MSHISGAYKTARGYLAIQISKGRNGHFSHQKLHFCLWFISVLYRHEGKPLRRKLSLWSVTRNQIYTPAYASLTPANASLDPVSASLTPVSASLYPASASLTPVNASLDPANALLTVGTSLIQIHKQ